MVESLLTFGAHRRALSIFIVVALSLLSGFGALRLQIDTSYDSLLNTKGPDFAAYETIIGEFGSDNTSIVYVRDPKLFSVAKLKKLEDLHYALEDIEGVEKIESLFSVTNIRDRDGDLDTGLVIDGAPEDEADAVAAKNDALYNPLFRRSLLSDDATVTAINVTVENVQDDPGYNRRVYDAIDKVIIPAKKDFQALFQVGPPRLNIEIEKGLFRDLGVLTPGATVILMGAIFLFLRTWLAALLPLVTAGLSIFWTMGFMGYAGIPLSLLTAILPALVIVIGSTEDTHMLSAYLEGLEGDDPKARRVNAIRLMARHVGLPIFITSITTVIGFLSNAVSDITMIQNFAYATSFAMFANLVSTVLVLPLILAVAGPLQTKLSADREVPSGVIGRTMKFLDFVSVTHERKVMGVLAAVLAGLLVFAFSIKVSNDPLSYFKDDNAIVVDANTLHRDLAGMQVFYLVVEADRGTDFKDSAQLRKIAEIVAHMRSQGLYDKVLSISDYVQLINREMHRGDKAFDTVPENRQLIEQYLLLFQRSDIERYLSADATRANIVVRHNMSDSAVLNRHIAALTEKTAAVFGPDAKISFSGKNLLINRAAEGLFVGQAQSLALLLAFIFVFMSILYTSLVAGVLALLPNIIPIIVMFGVMGLFDIPLNPGTAMVAVIAIGIAIDDTIHLLTAYITEVRKDADQVAASKRAVWQQKVPVISTSVALAAGFLVLQASTFNIVAQFGILSALTMVVAMITDLVITPILMRHLRVVGIWDIITLSISPEVLLKSDLFQDMSKFQIRKTILLSQMNEFEAGTDIIRQGTRGGDMFVILSGEVEIIHNDGTRDKQIAICRGGEFFGEVGYIGETDRMATVRTLTDVQLLRLDADKVAASLRLYPRIAAQLNRNISRVLGIRLAEIGTMLVHTGGSDGATVEA